MENNKLIAKFMGLRYVSDPISPTGYGWTNGKTPVSIDLKYNSSWDWLMPVVEKIEDAATDTYVEISESSTEIWGYPFRINIYKESKIESVYDAVVEFIKWYNKNNP